MKNGAMYELFPGIYAVPGENESRFPFCTCLYVQGSDLRVLIDAGMGLNRSRACLDQGVDVLILTHCHIDHRLNPAMGDLRDLPVWTHELEAPYLGDQELFLDGTGFTRGGFSLEQLFSLPGGLTLPVARTLIDGELIDLGGLTLQAIHTPGHTPGHLAFYIPEYDFLFAADVDLTSFGPFYGHDFADIDQFLTSIERLKSIGAGTILTGHAGPFTGDNSELFDAYASVVQQRESALLAMLDTPRTLNSFRGGNLVYHSYSQTPELIKWFEMVHLEKHLARLLGQGKVHQNGELWSRV